MSSKPIAILAKTGEVKDLVGVLRRGFHDEPAQEWLYRNPHSRALASELWFREMVQAALKAGEVWRLQDFSSVAVWFKPGAEEAGTSLAGRLLAILTAANRRTAKAKSLLNLELRARRPQAPHWYLAAVATEFGRRSLGHGRDVLRPVLDACDRDRALAYLETSAPRSLRFYESLGFTAWSSFGLADGPDVWCMGRHPPKPGEIPVAAMAG